MEKFTASAELKGFILPYDYYYPSVQPLYLAPGCPVNVMYTLQHKKHNIVHKKTASKEFSP